jgi:hypothetical protein
MTFKVGDKVKFTKLLRADSNYFSTGKVYTITNYKLDIKDTYLLNDILLYAYGHRLKRVIEDNPMNRMLYPELKPKDGILE